MTASMVSLREVITSIGSTASATAAASPAVVLHMRRTATIEQRDRRDPGEHLGQLERR